MHLEKLSPEERVVAALVNRNRVSISEFIIAVNAAVKLAFYDVPEDANLGFFIGRQWKAMAVREIAMMISHVGSILDTLPHLLEDCPAIREHVDMSKLQAAKDTLNAHFPDYKAIRTAVAHLGDHTKLPGRMDHHGWKGWTRPMTPEGPPPKYERTFEGTMFRATVRVKGAKQGERYVFRVEEDTADKLGQVDVLVTEAFRAASKAGVL